MTGEPLFLAFFDTADKVAIGNILDMVEAPVRRKVSHFICTCFASVML